MMKSKLRILASERSNNFLDTSRLQQLYPDVKPIKESCSRYDVAIS